MLVPAFYIGETQVDNMKKKQKKLLVFDFDGTALGGHVPYNQYPSQFVAFLDKLDSMGIQWATNTTWGVDEQFELIRRSGVKSVPLFLAGQTSRQLATVKNEKVIHDRKYEKRIVSREKRFRTRVWSQVRSILMELLKDDVVDKICFNFYNQNTIVYSCKKKNANKVWQTLKPLMDSGLYYPWNPMIKDSNTLLPHFFNKGEVIKEMMKRIGMSPDNIIVAGDETNDLHMFVPEIATYMVCPQNANPMLKKIVKKQKGVVSEKEFSWGVIDGVEKILSKKRE